jgi:Ca2+-binding EF-hand superfamily protein
MFPVAIVVLMLSVCAGFQVRPVTVVQRGLQSSVKCADAADAIQDDCEAAGGGELCDPIATAEGEQASAAEVAMAASHLGREHRQSIDLVLAEADAFFDAIDTNGDGAISVTELREHLSSIGYSAVAIDKIYEVLDTNADGSLSRDELRDAFVRYDDPALRLALGLGTSEADAVFDLIDGLHAARTQQPKLTCLPDLRNAYCVAVDRSGNISQEELQQYLAQQGFAGAIAASIFETLDENSDGQVSRQELHTGYVRYAALRQALGPMRARKSGNRKRQPIRWGRSRGKGEASA